MNCAASTRERFKGRSVLVTGGGGFVGANLARRLHDLGAKVHLLMRAQAATTRIQEILTEIRMHRGDITDEPSLARAFDHAAPDFVFHLATPRVRGASAWKVMTENNVRGAILMVEQMRRVASARLVVAGSSLEYGPNPQPHREQDALAPVTWHGVGKAAAGLVYRQAALSLGLGINQMRLFHVYGPWEASHRLLPTAIRCALAGLPIRFTAAEARRDWIYVDDVLDALLCAALSEARGETFNVGTGTELGNEEVVDVVEQVTGTRLARSPGAFPNSVSDSAHRRADIKKAQRLLGWTPRHDIASGVTATLAWYREHRHAWDDAIVGKPYDV